jgi:fatty acid desaturase
MEQLPERLFYKSSWRPLLKVFLVWLTIFASIYICLKVSFFFYPLSLLIIGSQIHTLTLLGHEGVHQGLFSSASANGFFARWICHFPAVVSTSRFERIHLLHHRLLGTDRDPDNYIYLRPLSSWRHWVAQVLREMLNGKAIYDFCYYFNGIPQLLRGRSHQLERVDQFRLFLFWLLVFSLVSYLGLWWYFLLFWILPFLLRLPWIQLINHFQHYHPQGPVKDFSYDLQLRNEFLIWFLFPLNAHLHTTHHLWPQIPWFRLRDPDIPAVPQIPFAKVAAIIFQS